MSTGSDLLLDGAGGDGLVDGPFEGAHQPGVAGQADFAGAGVDLLDKCVVEPDGNLLHDTTVSELTSDIDSDIIIGMTTTSNSLYRKSQVDALAKIKSITDRAAKGGMPELIWHIGWTGASGQCEDLNTLRLYAMGLGLEVVEYRTHWAVQCGSGVHLRYDGDK